MAINGATERGAVLTLRGNHYELAYRYESWVQFRSRPVRPRVDLAPLAERLNAEEAEAGGTARWVADTGIGPHADARPGRRWGEQPGPGTR